MRAVYFVFLIDDELALAFRAATTRLVPTRQQQHTCRHQTRQRLSLSLSLPPPLIVCRRQEGVAR